MKLPLKSKKEHWPAMIGEVAQRLGCSASLLRVLETQGVVKPARTSHGIRLYLNQDVKKIKQHLAALDRNKKLVATYRTELHRATVEAD